jgi:integrase
VAGHRIKKPYPDFPLSPHASGTWQKKIRGRGHYFGRWARMVNGQLERVEGDGWQEALEQYQAVADDLHAGRPRRVDWDSLTVAELCNRFLTAKQRQYEAGEISARMYKPSPDQGRPEQATGEYKQTTDRLVSIFGRTRPVKDLVAEDFEALRDALAKQFGPVRLGNEIQKVRTIFKYGFESSLIDRPIRYGPMFKKPSAAVMRRHKAKTGQRMLEADQVRRLIDAAGQPMRAMILLGVNAGFGNADCGSLPLSALDLDAGWVNFPRPKTGIERRCPLWPETVSAIREALAKRPKPKKPADAGLAFLTKQGLPWARDNDPGIVTKEFAKLLKELGIHDRKGIGFYSLRHSFRTTADAARDIVATDLIMGHSDTSMGSRYRERVEDSRLRAVVDVVYKWLFGADPDRGTAEPESRSAGAKQPEREADNARRKLRLYAG